jgi:hypothetical protein
MTMEDLFITRMIALGAIENGSGVRDKEVFQQACSVLFKEGRTSSPLPIS